MNQRDHLKYWIKELPQEQPSPDFSSKVMQRVMTEWSHNPTKYQPIISRKGWFLIALITILSTVLLIFLHNSALMGLELVGKTKNSYGLDATKIFTPLNHVFTTLTKISPTVAIGTFAILALWFFDQLFSKTVRR